MYAGLLHERSAAGLAVKPDEVKNACSVLAAQTLSLLITMAWGWMSLHGLKLVAAVNLTTVVRLTAGILFTAQQAF